MKSIKLDNLDGREIKKMLDENQIAFCELDSSSLMKVFDYETDMLVLGKGDIDFIEKCAELIDEKNLDSIIGAERFDEIVDKCFKENVITEPVEVNRKKTVKRKLWRKVALVAAILATLLAGTTVAEVAFDSNINDYLGDFVRGDEKVVEIDGMTIYRNDDKKIYSSVEELLEAEDLDILYPTQLPEGVRVTRITTGKNFKGEYDISFYTNDLNVSFRIKTSTSGHFIENANAYVHNGITYYIEQRNSVLVAGAIYNGYLYSVSASSKESLFLIINNLKESKP